MEVNLGGSLNNWWQFFAQIFSLWYFRIPGFKFMKSQGLPTMGCGRRIKFWCCFVACGRHCFLFCVFALGRCVCASIYRLPCLCICICMCMWRIFFQVFFSIFLHFRSFFCSCFFSRVCATHAFFGGSLQFSACLAPTPCFLTPLGHSQMPRSLGPERGCSLRWRTTTSRPPCAWWLRSPGSGTAPPDTQPGAILKIRQLNS